MDVGAQSARHRFGAGHRPLERLALHPGRALEFGDRGLIPGHLRYVTAVGRGRIRQCRDDPGAAVPGPAFRGRIRPRTGGHGDRPARSVTARYHVDDAGRLGHDRVLEPDVAQSRCVQVRRSGRQRLQQNRERHHLHTADAVSTRIRQGVGLQCRAPDAPALLCRAGLDQLAQQRPEYRCRHLVDAGRVATGQQMTDDGQRGPHPVGVGQSLPVRADHDGLDARIGTQDSGQHPDGEFVRHRLQPCRFRRRLLVSPALPQTPLDDRRRQAEGAPGIGQSTEERVGRGVVADPPRSEESGDRGEQHEAAHRGSQREPVQHRRGVQFGAEHGGDVGVAHLGDQRLVAGQRRQIHTFQRRQVGAEPLEQRGHRHLVGRVGRDLHQGAPEGLQLRRELVQFSCAASRYRDDRGGAHLGELADEVRPDVTGGADHQVAGVAHEPGETHRRRGAALQAGHMAQTTAVDGLIVVARTGLVGQDACDQFGRRRLVDVDDAGPVLGVLEPDGAAHAPQHRVRRVCTVTLVDRLGVAGQDEKLWRLGHPGQDPQQPPRRVEQPVAGGGVDTGDRRRRVDDVVDTGQRRMQRVVLRGVEFA